MALDPEFKAAWVKALRENKHRQYIGGLWGSKPNADGRCETACALGIAYEVLGIYNRDAAFGHTKNPIERKGLHVNEIHGIVRLNDDCKKDFDFIAAHIEQNL